MEKPSLREGKQVSQSLEARIQEPSASSLFTHPCCALWPLSRASPGGGEQAGEPQKVEPKAEAPSLLTDCPQTSQTAPFRVGVCLLLGQHRLVGLGPEGSPSTPSPRGTPDGMLSCYAETAWKGASAPQWQLKAAGRGCRQECQECGAAASFPLLFLPPLLEQDIPCPGKPKSSPLMGKPQGMCWAPLLPWDGTRSGGT